MINFEDFNKIDIRVGQIIKVEKLPNAKTTTHKLTIDFGKEIGIKQSCARVVNYSDEELIGKRIIGVINLPPKQIGQNMSEVFTVGLPDANGECVLVSPDKEIPLGGKLF